MFVHAWYVRHTPHQDYAEQVRTLQKIKEKLEIALEKHQDCTYFFSCFFQFFQGLVFWNKAVVCG